MRIAILGAGAWGTALAISLAAQHEVRLWTRNAGHLAEMRASRSNARYLAGFPFPSSLQLESELCGALAQAELALLAVPTAGFRALLREVAACGGAVPVVWVCKGLEHGSAKLLHQVAEEELPALLPRGVLSGPSFAQEVARGLPTALTLASPDEAFAVAAARTLHGQRLRIYTSSDVTGVEIGGAVKNVMAIAAGISDGLGLGHNARAALMTRGLAEITRLGLKLGGRLETFMGLTGLGDLILTCTGDLSRNRTVGLELARGRTLDAILAGLGHTAEGVYSARAIDALALSLKVDMPITRGVCRVLYENLAPATAAEDLMNREPRAEGEVPGQ